MTDRWGVPLELGDRRILRPGRFRRLRTVAWLVAFFFALPLAFGPAMDALGNALPDDDASVFLVRCAGAALALGAYAVLARLVEARWPRELAPRPALPGILSGLVLGVGMMAVVMAVLAGTGLYELRTTGWAPAWDALGSAVQAGVIEELLARAILLRLLWRAFGPWVALAVSSVVFGAGHLVNPEATLFAALCIALEAGIMLGALYALTGRLWVPIGVHTGWNFAQGYVFGAAVSGGDTGASLLSATADPAAPVVLTGGAFGPEASLVALLVCGGVGVAALLLARRAGRFRRETPDAQHSAGTTPSAVAAA
ncbi:CPBP family intramembrane metalloprotease [Kineococcus sp. NUM-3379]